MPYATLNNFFVLEKKSYVYQRHGFVTEWLIAMELKMSMMIPVVSELRAIRMYKY